MATATTASSAVLSDDSRLFSKSRAASLAPPDPPTPAAASPADDLAADADTEASPAPEVPDTSARHATPAPASMNPPPEPEPPAEDVIDMEVFNQILDLDEEGQFDFSAGMVAAFFTQAQTAFDDMEAAHAARDLKKLKELGHFLKGSSAALGIYKVKESCEAIQHYGALRDEINHVDLNPAEALARIRTTLDAVKGEYADASHWLRAWYADKGGIPDFADE